MVGFDDVAAAATSVPPLTTVSQSLFDQGRLAASVVLDQVAGREVRVPPIRTELVIRRSTARPRNPTMIILILGPRRKGLADFDWFGRAYSATPRSPSKG